MVRFIAKILFCKNSLLTI